jgi:hypothetical protein
MVDLAIVFNNGYIHENDMVWVVLGKSMQPIQSNSKGTAWTIQLLTCR